MSDYWAVGLSDRRTTGLSDYRTVGLLGCRTIGPPAKCCTGFMWNDDSKSCEQCSPGYVGINCSDPCLYPNYGIECQMLCTCSQPACNPSFGCDDTSPKIGNTVGISDISKTTKQTTDRVIDLNGSLKTNESFSISA
ncbi:scavenger receptor class F member 1-like [Saccostrea cucullata]|uniref:scavenger receptor class F member 1-like n=1 Tax=Saccostrea cuccullata TaxID=36930 RepID=UPI002ED3853E